ncbi:DUF6284 family protein [Micromonospora sp. WMMD882]|uniref:DUF6284 family protein n=1 Tax=Micromonospora sp. WMMD882 TaxID=3015151 RepID=UPI00248BC460|nr:DUF6284 family protein [Micromonospora sp. WMMD882]WBB81283.1 DUF6284 family protein [Micromonospora sp. WMMD882]
MRKHPVPTEPTPADLGAIDAEWPLVAAELDLLDAEISLIYAEDHGGPSPLDWRRVRRAEARVTRAAATAVRPAWSTDGCVPHRLVVVGWTGCSYRCEIVRCGTCGGEQVLHRTEDGCRAGTARAA